MSILRYLKELNKIFLIAVIEIKHFREITLLLVKKHYFFVLFQITVQTCGCAHHVNYFFFFFFLVSGLNSEIVENQSPGQSYINSYIAVYIGKGVNSIV